MDAVILDMSCTGSAQAGAFQRRQLLIRMDDNKVGRLPHFQTLRRCGANGETPAQPKPDCEPDARLYRSELSGDNSADSYQEMRFTGESEGTVELTEYRKGKAVWTAQGTHACSNGAVICSISFPLTTETTVDLAYDAVVDANNMPTWIVVPSLRQSVYMEEMRTSASDEERPTYSGLVVDFLNGFVTKEGEGIEPYNVYRYAGCKG